MKNYYLILLLTPGLNGCKEKKSLNTTPVIAPESIEVGNSKQYSLSLLEREYDTTNQLLDQANEDTIREVMIRFGNLNSKTDGALSEIYGATCFYFMEKNQNKIFSLLKDSDTIVLQQFASGVAGELRLVTDNSEEMAEYKYILGEVLNNITKNQGKTAQFLSQYYLNQLDLNTNY